MTERFSNINLAIGVRTQLRYYPDSDVLMMTISDLEVADTVMVSPTMVVKVANDGIPVQVHFLFASTYMDVRDGNLSLQYLKPMNEFELLDDYWQVFGELDDHR